MSTAMLAASAASADVRLVARGEAVGNPVFAGGAVAYPGLDARGTIVVRRAGGGVLARLGSSGEEDVELGLSGSASHLAVAHVREPERGPFTTRALIGAADGPLAPLTPFQCPVDRDRGGPDPSQAVALDGAQLAYVRETCSPDRPDRRVVIRDLSTGQESIGPPVGGAAVALAGRFVAFRAPADAKVVHVYDLTDGRIVTAARHQYNIANFDVQEDGKLALAWYGDYGREGSGVVWYAPGVTRPRPVPPEDYAYPPVAIENDRIAYVTEEGIRVWEIGRGERLRVRADSPWQSGVLGFDGERLAFATAGCSRDTGRVWVADLRRPWPVQAPYPVCRASFGRRLRLDAGGRTTLRVSCPTGCRGGVQLVRDTRARQALGRGRSFELRRGGRGRIRVDASRARAMIRGRRSLRVRIDVSLEQADQNRLSEFSRRATLRRR